MQFAAFSNIENTLDARVIKLSTNSMDTITEAKRVITKMDPEAEAGSVSKRRRVAVPDVASTPEDVVVQRLWAAANTSSGHFVLEVLAIGNMDSGQTLVRIAAPLFQMMFAPAPAQQNVRGALLTLCQQEPRFSQLLLQCGGIGAILSQMELHSLGGDAIAQLVTLLGLIMPFDDDANQFGSASRLANLVHSGKLGLSLLQGMDLIKKLDPRMWARLNDDMIACAYSRAMFG